jgi:hypothetical protein
MNKMLNEVEKVKDFVKALTETQDLRYFSLLDELGISEENENWLFDYIFNSGDDDETFQKYLLRYDKKVEDIIHE